MIQDLCPMGQERQKQWEAILNIGKQSKEMAEENGLLIAIELSGEILVGAYQARVDGLIESDELRCYIEDYPNSILASIQQSLPALAKEAGYKSGEEVDEIRREVSKDTFKKLRHYLDRGEPLILPWALDGTETQWLYEKTKAGYVELAKDQTLPQNPYERGGEGAINMPLDIRLRMFEAYVVAQQDVIEAGWRKVILSEEIGCLLCMGQGWVLDLHQERYTCPKCKGTGKVKEE